MITLNGTTGITSPNIDSDVGNNTPADGSFTTLSMNGGALSPQTGFKNRIINGGMTIDQRNAGASVTPSGVAQFTVDRFVYIGTQVSKMTLQQVSDAPAGFNNSLKLTVASAATPSASDQFRFSQPIEGFNVADLGWGTANAQAATVSFKAKASLAGSYSVALWNGANGRSYVTTVSLTTAWASYSFTVPGDTTGTWGTGNGVGIELIFDVGGGSNWVTPTANAWQASNYFKASGSVSLVSNAAATLNITGVQLEKGSVATPFEFRSIGQELALCQRYFEAVSVACGYGIVVNSSFAPNVTRLIKLDGVKRASPTVTIVVTSIDNAAAGNGSIPYANASSFVHNSGANNTSFPYNSISIAYSASAEL